MVGVTPAAAIAAWPGIWDDAIPEAESRRLFQRTLAGWATDVLRLKRRGMDVPVLTRREARLVTPGRDRRQAA